MNLLHCRVITGAKTNRPLSYYYININTYWRPCTLRIEMCIELFIEHIYVSFFFYLHVQMNYSNLATYELFQLATTVATVVQSDMGV